MWTLNPEQTALLTSLQRRRDLHHIGVTLGTAFPEPRGRLGERWLEFIELGAVRAAAYGMGHMLCVARLLATWIVCGAEFESRQPWAAAILTDSKRGQGVKAYQLCVRVVEQLRSAPQPGQPLAADFAESLRQLDGCLAGAGQLASLLPRERIRLGSACDLDAVELRLVDTAWRQRYTAQGGPWRRESSAPQIASVTLVHDAQADAAPQLPTQLTLLSHPSTSSNAARLRVRVKTEHRCDALLHPLVHWLDPVGSPPLRGELAADTTFTVHASPPDDGAQARTRCMGEESSARYSPLRMGSCGLRARGVPIGELSTMLAAFDATQHLIAWRRESMPAWQLPAGAPPAIVPTRCRRESDGEVVDASEWQAGFLDLDTKLQQGLARLSTAWERESGVTDGKLEIEAGLLVGSAGVTWGWAEGPLGITAPPYMRVEGLLDLVACQLSLRFSGTLARAGSRSLLVLSTHGSVALTGPWQRGPDDAGLFVVAAGLQRAVRQTFELSVQSSADPSLAVLGSCGVLKGAISGTVGLEQRPDGPGLRWYVRLKVEPVVVLLRLADPLLGVQMLQVSLLPAQTLVDWSQA